jgi:hypothetical protein
MNDVAADSPLLQREALVHALYEAAELEHNLMCTYLYAAASLRDGHGEGLSEQESAAVRRWKQALLGVAIEEMGHLAAVWNITSALGGSPRFGRTNFPLDPGYLPASVVVKLAPFNADTLQHFVFLERPHGSTEPDGAGFAYERPYVRGGPTGRLTPMAIDYDTVGAFYAALGEGLKAFVAKYGEANTFDGDRALQLSEAEVQLAGARAVVCLRPRSQPSARSSSRARERPRTRSIRTIRSSSASAPNCARSARRTRTSTPPSPRPRTRCCGAHRARKDASGSRTPRRWRRWISPTPVTV